MAIEQDIGLHSHAAALRERFREFARQLAALKKILSKRDGGFGRLDIPQHHGKRVAVEQNLDAIAADNRCVGVRLDGGKKRRLAERDRGQLLNGDDLGATGENEDEEKQPRCKHGSL